MKVIWTLTSTQEIHQCLQSVLYNLGRDESIDHNKIEKYMSKLLPATTEEFQDYLKLHPMRLDFQPTVEIICLLNSDNLIKQLLAFR